MSTARGIQRPDRSAQRDNLLRVVRFERPDYIPMTFHINAACWFHYPREALLELMGTHPFLFPDADSFTPPSRGDLPPFVTAGQRWTDPWGCVWETPMDGIVGAVVEHPLASWDNFETYQPPDPDRVTHWGPIDWNAAAATLGPAICQSCLRNGEIGHNHTWLKLTDMRGYADTLCDMADDEPRLRRLLELLEQFNAGLVRNYIRHGRAEWIGFAEDLGMQQGPMLSPAQFREYIAPSYRRLMGIARDAGCIVHVHADGDLRALAPDLLGCGVDVLNLQDLVNGIDWIAANLAGKVCIDLDIDRQDVTVRGTPQQVDDLIREEVRVLGRREGGLMLIYGMYPGTPLENAVAVADAMERYAAYG